MDKKVHTVQKPDRNVPDSTDIPSEIKALQAEVAKLQKELKHEQLRADAYDTMIDIAESPVQHSHKKKSWCQTVMDLHVKSKRDYPVEESSNPSSDNNFALTP